MTKNVTVPAHHKMEKDAEKLSLAKLHCWLAQTTIPGFDGPFSLSTINR